MSLSGLHFSEKEFMQMPTSKRRRYYNICIEYNQKQDDDFKTLQNKNKRK